MDEVTAKLVAPFYRAVLHGNVVNGLSGDPDEVLRQMRAAAQVVTFQDALYLWPRGWREGLMASWWAAVWRWPETPGQIEPLLIPGRSCFEGLAHCLALARIGSPRCRVVLARYLDEYLPRRDLGFDQPWAMAAMTTACTNAGESVPEWFGAAWGSGIRAPQRGDLSRHLDTMSRITFADAVSHR